MSKKTARELNNKWFVRRTMDGQWLVFDTFIICMCGWSENGKQVAERIVADHNLILEGK